MSGYPLNSEGESGAFCPEPSADEPTLYYTEDRSGVPWPPHEFRLARDYGPGMRFCWCGLVEGAHACLCGRPDCGWGPGAHERALKAYGLKPREER